MTCNVFGGMLNLAQSVCQLILEFNAYVEVIGISVGPMSFTID